jgi:hypothetical protein
MRQTPISCSLTKFKKKLVLPSDQGHVYAAQVLLQKYDGNSNLELFVNNYMIFSSEKNCMMSYQCNSSPPKMDFVNKYASIVPHGSIHHVSEIYPLPYPMSVFNYLAPGINYIDIVSGNSGIRDCDLELSIVLTAEKFQLTRVVRITPSVGLDSEPKSDDLNSTDLFYSYGRSNDEKAKLIEPYLTRTADVSYRLCERIRYVFDILEPIELTGAGASR